MNDALPDTALNPTDRDFVAALASGLDVVMAFDEAHPRMTLSEVAERTGMNRAKARRFLLTLHALGYVRKQQRYFELTPKVLKLGFAYLASNHYRGVIQQHLEEITQQCGESSSLGVLDGGEVIYLARSAAPHRLMAITLSVGTRLPAAYTSIGRVLLAQLPESELDRYLSQLEMTPYTRQTLTDHASLKVAIQDAHRQGHAVVDQELDSGLRSIAVPVFDTQQTLIGAINISTNAARVETSTLLETYLPLLKEKARLIHQTVSL